MGNLKVELENLKDERSVGGYEKALQLNWYKRDPCDSQAFHSHCSVRP